jgi:hypothetical protein
MTSRTRPATSEISRPNLEVPGGAVLEGGYHIPSLTAGVIAMTQALAGEDKAHSAAPEFAHTPRAASYVGTTGASRPTQSSATAVIAVTSAILPGDQRPGGER